VGVSFPRGMFHGGRELLMKGTLVSKQYLKNYNVLNKKKFFQLKVLNDQKLLRICRGLAPPEYLALYAKVLSKELFIPIIDLIIAFVIQGSFLKNWKKFKLQKPVFFSIKHITFSLRLRHYQQLQILFSEDYYHLLNCQIVKPFV